MSINVVDLIVVVDIYSYDDDVVAFHMMVINDETKINQEIVRQSVCQYFYSAKLFDRNNK
jgi:hypothetical protein